jgi:ATP-dependent Clp protease ATP-binding subunit ClpA
MLWHAAVQVGKATLGRTLAEALFGSDRHLLRLNLAEFADKASVSRLIGAPAGYVGYGDGGLLSDAIRWVGRLRDLSMVDCQC